MGKTIIHKELTEKYLEWVGTISLITGAILSSLNIFPWNVVAFLMGGVFWVILGKLWKKNSVVILNASMMSIYIFGVIKGFNWW